MPQLTRRRLLQGLGATATAAFAAEFLPPNVRGFSDPKAIKLPDGKSVFYQPDTANPDGYLLPFHPSPARSAPPTVRPR